MYYLTVYNEPIVQPAEPEDLDVDGIAARHLPARRRRERTGPRAQLLASGVGVPWALEAQAAARARTGASPPTSGRSPRGPSCAATASPPTSTTSCNPDAEPPHVPYVTQKLRGRRGPVRRGQRLHARGAGPDPPVRARRLRDARRRRLRLLATPAPAARRFFKIDGPSIVVRTLQSLGAPRRGRPARSPAQAIEKYRLHDVTAGTTGTAGGES